MTEENKLYLLKETAEFNFVNEVDENGKKKVSPYGNMIVKGILQKANTVNQNGRIYPKDVLQREIENYRKLIKERRALGECDHAEEPVVNLKHTSHVITDVWWEGDVVMGQIEILEGMDQGRQVKTLFENGIKVGISSRAIGSVKTINGIHYVQDDLQLICWDFVSEPSTPGAFMFQEARLLSREELRKIQDSCTKTDRLNRIANEILGIKKI